MSIRSIMQNTGWVTAFILYVIADFICIGAGMGVPIFSLFLGFPVGWYAARCSANRGDSEFRSLRHVMSVALITSSVTGAAMFLIWGRCIPMIFDKTYDFANFGHPMILYDPWYSFIAWLVLMILISPFLQFLFTLLAAQATLVVVSAGSRNPQQDIF